MKGLAIFLLISSFSICAEAGLVAWYEFEGNANDSIGSNHGTMMDGASIIIDSQRGQVLSLDGENDYVSLAECTITTTEFTLAAWANHLGPGGGTLNVNPVFSQRDDATDNNRCCISLKTVGEDGINAGTSIRSSIGTGQVLLSPSKPYDQWHHYAITISSEYFIFYVDGIEANRAPNQQSGDYTTSIDYIAIGRIRYNDITRGFFNGFIDDVRFYDDALSPEEVRALVPEPGTLALFGICAVYILRNRHNSRA